MAAPIVRPVAAVSPPATVYRPVTVAPASTTGLARQVAATPGLVLAVPKPGWPAPTSTAVIGVQATAAERIPVRDPDMGKVVSSNIFGGPVTVGDPGVTTVIMSAYTDKKVTAAPPISIGEGWTDIFGQQHGSEVISHVPGGRPNAMGVRTPLRGYGAFAGGGFSWLAGQEATDDDLKVFKKAGKDPSSKEHQNQYLRGFTTWGNAQKAAGKAVKWNEYGAAVLAGTAAPPDGWKVGGSMMMYAAIGVGVLAVAGGAFYFLKRKKAQ